MIQKLAQCDCYLKAKSHDQFVEFIPTALEAKARANNKIHWSSRCPTTNIWRLCVKSCCQMKSQMKSEGQVVTLAHSDILFGVPEKWLRDANIHGDGAAETAGSDGAWMSDEINVLAQIHNIIRLSSLVVPAFCRSGLT
jgi:hypothetical protein